MHIKRLGVFDSGVGGLSILQSLKTLPIPEFIYCADTANLPYGEKTPEQITALTARAIQFLLDQQVDAIVLACHTASSVTLPALAQRFHQIPILGVVDPVVHKAVTMGSSTIGVIGTPATIASAMHRTKIHACNPQVQVILQACPLLVPLIEDGLRNTNALDQALEQYLAPLRTAGIDALIIGCTHYELIKEQIQRHVPATILISAQEEITSWVCHLLNAPDHTIEPLQNPAITYMVTGDHQQFRNNAYTLLGLQIQTIRHPWPLQQPTMTQPSVAGA